MSGFRFGSPVSEIYPCPGEQTPERANFWLFLAKTGFCNRLLTINNKYDRSVIEYRSKERKSDE
jgi:hypothetical protein